MSELQETAFRLYTSGESYDSVRKELGVTKKRVIELVRAQGEKFLEMADNVKESENDPDINAGIYEPQPMAPHQPILPMAMTQPSELSYADQEYELELTAIPKKITLTAYHIGIFDVFVNGGYTGTLSEFAQNAFEFIFARTTPQGRAI